MKRLEEKRRKIHKQMQRNSAKIASDHRTHGGWNNELLEENHRLTRELEKINRQLWLLSERVVRR